MLEKFRGLFTGKVILAGAGIACGLCLFWGVLFLLMKPAPGPGIIPTAILTVIPLPVESPTPLSFDAQSTPTPGTPVVVDGISVGAFVQISGTGGDGLRLRQDAGMEAAMQFVGMEAEVFQVKDGPRQKDELTWWYLMSPYDEKRSGWAAASYLVVVSSGN